MRSSILLAGVSAFAASLAAAQTTAPPSTITSAAEATGLTAPPTATSSGPVQTHTILAGDEDFSFNPSVVYANVGDIILWDFFPQNHSVVRGNYEGGYDGSVSSGNPCAPSNNTPGGPPVFASRWFLLTNQDETPPTYSVRVNDTNPIWYYCSTPGSCTKHAMLGVINPFANQSFSAQQKAAYAAPFTLQPGESVPGEDDQIPGTTSASHGLTPGAIAGIVVGVVLGIALVCLVFYFVGRSKTYADMLRGTRTHKKRTPPPVSAPAFNPNAEMGMAGYQDYKGPHSAMVSPAFPPPYASPEQAFAHTAGYAQSTPGSYAQYGHPYGMNPAYGMPMQQHEQPDSRFSELQGEASRGRDVSELDADKTGTSMRFDDGDDMQKR